MTTTNELTELLTRFERQANRFGELWERCQGKGWPDAESDEFTKIRDELLPALKQQIIAERDALKAEVHNLNWALGTPGYDQITICRFLGRSVQFPNGLSLGFNWIHGNGQTSKTSAVIAGYHPSWSLTWGWSVDWNRPQRLFSLPNVSRWTPRPGSGYGSVSVTLPLIGGFTVRWQPLMRRRGA